MQYLIFDTKDQAVQAERAIYNVGVVLAKAEGYTVDAAGIAGKSSGVDNAAAAKTAAWDVPRQRLDGKWIVLHPIHHPAATDANGAALLAQLGPALSDVPVELEDPSWWPEVTV